MSYFFVFFLLCLKSMLGLSNCKCISKDFFISQCNTPQSSLEPEHNFTAQHVKENITSLKGLLLSVYSRKNVLCVSKSSYIYSMEENVVSWDLSYV